MEQTNNLEGTKEKIEEKEEREQFEGEIFSDNATKEPVDHKTTIKNLISTIIVLVGVAAGSFFVDVVQFVSGSGYSEKALKETGVFVAGDKTWVAFDDPAVEIEVLTLSEEDMDSCENCDPTEVLAWLKRFMPTLIAKRVDVSSVEGENLISKYKLKSLPAFVFSREVESSEFYEGEASILFEEREDKFVLNSTGLGIPVGKYLEAPAISEKDPQKGKEDAKVKVIVYSDFQCPYCKQFHDEIVSIIDGEFKEDVLLVYKDMPLEFHPRAKISAIAGRCAQDQDKFWEMAALLYEKQEEWGDGDGVEDFKLYAKTIGLETNQFNDCIDNKEHLEEIQANAEEAAQFGVSGTPATFINEKFVSGVVELEGLRSMIKEELEK